MISIKIREFKVQFHFASIILLIVLIALSIVGINIAEQFFILFFMVTLHELGHIMTAKFFNLQTEQIIISPIGETAIIKNIELLSLSKKTLVIIAGPLVNIVLFLFTSLFFPDQFEFFKMANLYMAFFNLLPVLPLDGGRLLNFYLSNALGVIPCAKTMNNISFVLSKVVIVLGFIQVILFPFNISLLLIGVYLGSCGEKEYLFSYLQFYRIIIIKNDKLQIRKNLPIRTYLTSGKSDLKSLFYKLCWDYYYVFYIITKGCVTHTLTENQLIDYVVKNGLSGNIEDILASEISS